LLLRPFFPVLFLAHLISQFFLVFSLYYTLDGAQFRNFPKGSFRICFEGSIDLRLWRGNTCTEPLIRLLAVFRSSMFRSFLEVFPSVSPLKSLSLQVLPQSDNPPSRVYFPFPALHRTSRLHSATDVCISFRLPYLKRRANYRTILDVASNLPIFPISLQPRCKCFCCPPKLTKPFPFAPFRLYRLFCGSSKEESDEHPPFVT